MTFLCSLFKDFYDVLGSRTDNFEFLRNLNLIFAIEDWSLTRMIDFAIDFKLRPGAAKELNLLFLHLLHKSLSTSEGRNVDVV